MFAKANQWITHKKGLRGFILRLLAIAIIVVQLFGSGLLVKHTYGATVTQGTVKIKSGNVRKEASTASSVTFCVSSGEAVAILGEEKGKDGNTWYKIAVGQSVGYIRSDLVTKTDKQIAVQDSLVSSNKAQESSSSSESSKKEDAKESSSTNANPPSSESNNMTGFGIVKGTNVRMRKDASVNSGISKVLDKGTFVTILGEGKAADGAIWYYVKTDESTGFIRSDLLSRGPENTNSSSNSNSNNENSNNENKADDSKTEEVTEDIPADEPFDSDKYVPGKGVVKGTSVRIRDKASLTGNIITSVGTGTPLSVYGLMQLSDRDWFKVGVTVDGTEKIGFIAADYFDMIKGISEKNSSANDENKTDNSAENNKEENNDEEANQQDKPAQSIQFSESISANSNASINGVGVRIRQEAVIGNVICQLSSGHPLMVLGDVTAEDGYKWYQVSFSYQGSDRQGYVRSDFVVSVEEEAKDAPVGDEEFENLISQLPESYKNPLRNIHAKHPNWTFEIVDTGLDWMTSLIAESSVGKNLVSKNSIASWKSTAAQAYNWSTNTWYTFDGGSWASASPELIAYYMDPRNFLTESGIYQFENLDYKDTQDSAHVSKMLAGTFMSDTFTEADGTVANYADTFVSIGQLVGVSPYLLAGRCIQEQGIYGKSQSISGVVPGYEGYYNYYNIGAYAYGGRSATINGLIYAKGTDDSNLRPWNARIKSIYGGAKYIAEKYVSKGQNTLYFQKFNVINSENTIYSHQYMTNIQAASSEAARLQLAYINDDEALNFRIPYYQNMPEGKCAKPTSDSNPNTYLASLSVDGFELYPAFSGLTENYFITVDQSVESININASSVSGTSAVGGIGTYPVAEGTNVFYVVCKAQNGALKTYTITVQR